MNSELDKNGLVFDLVWERICGLTGWKRYGQLADFLKIKPASVAGAKKRGFISLEWVYKVAQGYNISTDWLATGEGPMKRGEVEQESPRELEEWQGEGYVQVPRYEIAASAGGGAVVHSEQIVDHLAFKAEWVRDYLRVPPKALALISVTGDSMEPTLGSGDLILIDLRSYRLDADAIYVLTVNGALLVKRVRHDLKGNVEITSDNPRYGSTLLTPDSADQVAVVGRVIWYGKRG